MPRVAAFPPPETHRGKPCHPPRDLLIMGVLTRATPPSSSSAAPLSCSWRFRASCSFTVAGRPRHRSCSPAAGHATAAAPLAVMWPLRRGRRFASAQTGRARAILRTCFWRSKLVCVSPGRWAHRLQELHVHLHSDLCRCQLDLRNLAGVRLLACLWA